MKRGQSLIELLVAIALAAIFFGGAVLLITQFLTANKLNREIQVAIDLGGELTDSIRVFSEQDWQNLFVLSKGVSNQYYVTTTPSFAVLGGNESITVGGISYTRWFYVASTSRGESGNIEAVYSQANADPSTYKIVTRITWAQNSDGLSFSEFLTRSKNRIFRQTDWSGGGGQELFPSSSTINNKFKDSSGLDYSKTGEIKVQ